jgi:hypothetical protein
MSIDPMAAVTTTTDVTGSSAAGADLAASSTPQNVQPGGQQNVNVADKATRVDLFDYATQQHRPPAIDTLAPESKAKYLANPQALGEQVLGRMESLHQRSLDYRNEMSRNSAMAQAAPSGVEGDVMAGPASNHVAGTANSNGNNSLGYLNLMFDYALETTMISSSSTQFVSGVNTLMRGQ